MLTCPQLLAFPLEMVARRLQVECGPLAGGLGFRGMLTQIVCTEGPLALYRCACALARALMLSVTASEP